MREPFSAKIRRSSRVAALAMLVLSTTGASLLADEVRDRRAHAGVRLFRTLLVADLDVTKKTIPGDQLLVVFHYVNDRNRALDLARRFMDVKDEGKIRGLTVVTEVTNDSGLATYGSRIPAGIFISEPVDKAPLRSLIAFGIQKRVIVYSPHEGHVESGVLGGLSVEAQVRPFVNAATLQASAISLSEFFLKVTKVYR